MTCFQYMLPDDAIKEGLEILLLTLSTTSPSGVEFSRDLATLEVPSNGGKVTLYRTLSSYSKECASLPSSSIDLGICVPVFPLLREFHCEKDLSTRNNLSHHFCFYSNSLINSYTILTNQVYIYNQHHVSAEVEVRIVTDDLVLAESSGSAEVCVELDHSPLAPVSVLISTEQDTALGMYVTVEL